MSKTIKILIGSLSLGLFTIFIVNPTLTINSMLQGINIWATKILPALFPFFVFTKILSTTGTFDYIALKLSPITKAIFNTSGLSSYVYICSIISGYPVGAKLVSELYNLNKINEIEAKKIISFTSTSGPLFIIGTVAIGMFNNQTLGYIVILSHIIGSIINGILYRNKYKITNTYTKSYHNKSINLEDIITTSIQSILIIGAYISIFYMLISIIDYYGLFMPIFNILNKITNIDINLLKAILYGSIEITKGCLILSSINLPLYLQIIICTTIISFSGICIHLQSYIFLRQCNIKYKEMLIQKITQTIISIFICITMCYIFI